MLCYNWCCDNKETGGKKCLQSNMFKPPYSSFVLPLPDDGGIWSRPVGLVTVLVCQDSAGRLHRPDLLSRCPLWCQTEPELRAALASFVLFGVSLKVTENVRAQFCKNFTGLVIASYRRNMCFLSCAYWCSYVSFVSWKRIKKCFT